MASLLAALFGLALSEPRHREPDALLAGAARIRARMSLQRRKRLEVQRILYMANLLHVARYDAPLFDDELQATTYGPLFTRAMDDMVRYALRKEDAYHPASLSDVQRALIDEVCDHYGDATGGQMVSVTQTEGTAWAKRYRTGFPTDRGPRITVQDLRDEVAGRMAEKTAVAA